MEQIGPSFKGNIMTYSARRRIQNVTNLIDYSSSPQAVSTTITAYNGTEVTYTPTSAATSVVLEVNLSLSYFPDYAGTLASTRLQESTDSGVSWSTLAGFKAYEGNESGDYNVYMMQYVFILPTWSGSKMLRLAGRSDDSSHEYSLGYAWNNDTGSAPLFGAHDAPAHISIYSVE